MVITNQLETLMGYQLRRASIAMSLDLRARLKPFGVTPTLACILILINSNNNLTQSALSKILAIKRANMVAAINTLETKGYVFREAIDGRSQKLLLTDSGNEIVEGILKATDDNEYHFKSLLGDNTADTIVSSLSAVWEECE